MFCRLTVPNGMWMGCRSGMSSRVVDRVATGVTGEPTAPGRRSGGAASRKRDGHRPRLLLPHRDWLIAHTANDQPFTLRGLQVELAERGVKVDYRTMWASMHAEGLSLKKTSLAKLAVC